MMERVRYDLNTISFICLACAHVHNFLNNSRASKYLLILAECVTHKDCRFDLSILKGSENKKKQIHLSGADDHRICGHRIVKEDKKIWSRC